MPKDSISKPYDKKGMERLVKATFFSFQGIVSTFKCEEAFRLEFIAATFLFPIALLLPIGVTEKVALISSLFLILIVEILNSAIEWTINYISTEIHPIAKKVKDMGSAAVFLSLCNALFVWTLLIKSNWHSISDRLTSIF
jgi:diacylglycerol kinase (ATP)